MANSNNTTDCKQVSDLKLPYLEDLLSQDEKAAFEEHLSSCSECAAELEATKRFSETVQKNSQALCLDPWEIFECAQDPQSMSISAKAHLEHCPACKEYLEDFRASAFEHAMPQRHWDKMTAVRDHSAPAQPHVRLGKWIEAVSDAVRSFLRTPAFALATAAAAVLVFVLVYPNLQSEPTVLLSQAQWESVLIKRQLMGSSGSPGEAPGQEPRVAELIFAEQSRDHSSSSWIDKLYSELEPTGEFIDRYQWVTPSEVKRALVTAKAETADRKAMLQVLRDKMGVTLAIIVTIDHEKTGQPYDLSAELVDPKTGKTLARKAMKGVKKDSLASGINAATLSLLKNASNNGTP